jgi:hypothetical protein
MKGLSTREQSRPANKPARYEHAVCLSYVFKGQRNGQVSRGTGTITKSEDQGGKAGEGLAVS